jgi:iron complex outermembrane receptor protein
MVYTNYGKSWREGPSAIGIFRPLTPRLTEFTQLKDETSKSIEAGFKAQFLEQRLRINASVFHQDFTNFIYRGPQVYYVDLRQSGPQPSTFNFVANVDAKVDGAELEIAYQPLQRWTVNGAFSYAKGKIKNGLVACNDFNGDGVPDTALPATVTTGQIGAAAGPGEAVAACRVNFRLSTSPDFSATLQSEYSLPVTTTMDGFVRGLYSFFGSNPQDPINPYDNVRAYGLFNLYTGVRSNDGAWEVALFGKNLFNDETRLNSGNNVQTTSYTNPLTQAGATLSSLYATTRITAQREFGINLRYAFGSR